MALSLGAPRVAHWQSAAPGAQALRAAAPRVGAARLSLSVQAEFSSQERRIRRHNSLRKKVRAGACGAVQRGLLRAPRRVCDGLALTHCRAQVNGSEERPRLAVFRSNQHIYAQARTRRSLRAAWPLGRPCAARGRLRVSSLAHATRAQVIDDVKRITLVGLGSVSEEVKKALGSEKKSATKNKEAATVVGRMIAEKCKEKGIEAVVFDRGGFKYHGRISALADAAREAGLNF